MINRSRRTTDLGTAIPVHIPCKAEPRRELPPTVLDSGIAGKIGIALEEYSRRGVVEPYALDSLLQFVLVKIHGTTVAVDHRRIRLPSQAVVQSHSRSGFPRIGAVYADRFVALVLWHGGTGVEL